MSQMQELASSAYFRSLVEQGTPLIEIKREYSATTSPGTVARAYHIVKSAPKDNGHLLDEPEDAREEAEDADFVDFDQENEEPSTELIVAEMTRREAEAAVAEYVGHVNRTGEMLLVMFERKAHTALGFPTWEGFCAARLGLYYHNTYHSDLLRAARVERNLILVDKNSDQSEVLSTSSTSNLHIKAALELSKLPNPQAQREAYEEYKEVFKHPHTPRQAATSLKHIVNRKLMQAGKLTVPEEKAKPAPAEPAVVKEIVLHFLEAKWEGVGVPWLRVDVRLPDGKLAIVRVPKGAIPG